MFNQSSQIKEQDVKAFLKNVAEGEETQAETLLKQTPNLALVPGDVTDLSGRTFKNITGFQYAVWALDWHMWTMIRKYLPDDVAREQIQGMKDIGSFKKEQHGKSVSWQNLLDALQEVIDLYNKGKDDETDIAWNKKVGRTEWLLPVHAVNEYCHPSRSFDPCPDFTVSDPLPRTRKVRTYNGKDWVDGEWFTATYNKGKLGDTFAFARSYFDSATMGWTYLLGVGYVYVGLGDCEHDLKACHTLLETRTQQRDQLFAELSSSNRQVTPQIKVADIKAFLKLVAEGEQDAAEALLQKNPNLALASGDVTDLSGRTFKNITAFQYAVWALDWHMWTMLRKYLPNEQALAQLQAMPKGSWVSQHGQSASWKNLTDALQKFIGLCEKPQWSEADTCWEREVGGAQRLLPAHVINEYCRPDRPFEPCPDFTLTTPLPRTRKVQTYNGKEWMDGEWFTATYNGGKLGEKFGVVRYNLNEATVDVCGDGLARGMRAAVTADLKSCLALYSARTQQRNQLATDLTNNNRQATVKAPSLVEPKNNSGRFLKVEESSSSSSLSPGENRSASYSNTTEISAPQSGILQALQTEWHRKTPTADRPLPALSEAQKPAVNVLFQNLERLEQEKTEITRLSGADVQARTKESQILLQQQTVLEQQRNQSILEQENLKTQIAKLERELKTKSDKREQDKIKAELLGLTERLTGVESQVAILMVEYEIKAKKREALQRFQNHPNLLLFYRTVHIKLEEIFISMKAVAGGFVNPVEGNVATAKSIVEGLGDMVSIAPLVGPAVEKILKWGVSKVLGKVDETRQNNTAANASALVTLSEVKKVAEGVARQLTESYAEQLLMLVTLEDEQKAANRLQMGIQKTKAVALKQAPCPPAKQLASFAVLWMADVIYDAHQIKDEPLDVLLLSQVRQKSPPGKVKAFWGDITAKLGIAGLKTIKDDCWPPEEVLTLPGIKVRTLEGKFEHYASSTLNPKKYGWRIADFADVQVLKLQVVSNPENTRQDPMGVQQIQAFGKQVHVNEITARQAQLEVERLRKENEELRRKQEEDNQKTQERLRAMEAKFAVMQTTSKSSSSSSSSPLLTPAASKKQTVYMGLPRPKSPRDSRQDEALATFVIQQVRSIFPQLSTSNHFYYASLSGEEAVRILQNQTIGTFLIRANSEKNGIVISYVDEENSVQHTLLKQSSPTQFMTVDNQTVELAALLREYQHAFTKPFGGERKSASNNNRK